MRRQAICLIAKGEAMSILNVVFLWTYSNILKLKVVLQKQLIFKNFLNETAGRTMVKRPQKVRQIFLTQIVQAAKRACCLCNAGGKPFNLALIRLLL